MESALVSAGALCALCGDLAGPYDLEGLAMSDDVWGLHRFHSPCSIETGWGPELWPAQGSVLCRGSSCSSATSGSVATDPP